MPGDVSLSLADWCVLGVLAEQPAHGFAVASATGSDGSVGAVWRVPRPLVYRAIARLDSAGLIRKVGAEASGAGPERTVWAVTELGRSATDVWLVTPVEHVRDARSDLLVKITLLQRRGLPIDTLLEAQRTVFEATAERLIARRAAAPDEEWITLTWRVESTRAALSFLSQVRERSAGG